MRLGTVNMGKLLFRTLEQKQTGNKRKIKIHPASVCKHFMNDYFTEVLKRVTAEPISHDMNNPNVSHIQVLQKEAKKGYEWDMKYGGFDWDILLHNNYAHAIIEFDRKWLDLVLKKAAKGQRYMEEIVNPAANLRAAVKVLK